MTSVDIALTLAIIAVFTIIVAAANYADREHSSSMRRWVGGALLLINMLVVMVLGILQVTAAYQVTDEVMDDVPEKSAAWGAFAVAVVLAAAATALLSQPVRERIARLFPRAQTGGDWPPATPTGAYRVPEPDRQGTPLFPQMLNYYTTRSPEDVAGVTWAPALSDQVGPDRTARRGFDPASTVHMVALIFVLYFIGNTAANFILGGGLSGVAEAYSATELDATDLLFNMLPLVVLPLAGVGLGIRRNGRQVLARLGLRPLSFEGTGAGIASAIGLIMLVGIVGAIWQSAVSPETFEEQTEASDALTESINTIGLAFMVAATAAIGEEVAFRGALQPVFGFWPTAIIFALTHIQYALTPATLIILGVALVFGWLRKRYNTTAAMLAHFVYDFIPLALVVSFPDATLQSLLHLL